MAKIPGAQSVADTAAGLDPTPRERALLKENEALFRRIDELKEAQGQAEVLLAAMLQSAIRLPHLGTDYKPAKAAKSITDVCESVLVFTDWHTGKHVEATEVLGENEFNYEVLRDRIVGPNGVVAQKLSTVLMERSNIPIHNLRVMVLGDMVNGNLRPEDGATNEFSEAEQPVYAGALLAEALAMLAPHFTQVNVEFVVPDNHSRLTKKISHKQPWNSWNYIVAKYAEAKTELIPNIIWKIHPGEIAECKMDGMVYLMRHGHDMSKGSGGFGGLPFYGFERATGMEARKRMRAPRQEKVQSLREALGIPNTVVFDRLVFGHFHTYAHGPDWRVCPSPCGTDNFDHASGRHSQPAQVGWIVHPKRKEMNLNVYDLE